MGQCECVLGCVCVGVCVRWGLKEERKLAGHGFYLYLWALRSALHFCQLLFLSLSLPFCLLLCLCLSGPGWLGLSDL